jgi:diguanylate cyclase (GGDEF)-like protein
VFNQSIRKVIIPLMCLFVTISSLVLGKAPYSGLLLLSGCLFCASVVFYKKIPYSTYFQPVFLAFFHWASHLNWCQLLYFILIAMAIQNRPALRQILQFSINYSLLYTVIRLSYVPLNKYNIMVSFYDIFSFILLLIFVRYLFTAEMEKRRLQRKNQFLTTHDPLTKLLNYEGYIRSIKHLINKKKSNFVLVLLDFQDFKSVNNESISNGNDILINISLLLQTYFPNASAISRYAGDRFALMIPLEEKQVDEICSILDSKRLGYEVTYSLALYPDEAITAQEIITLAEDRLFQNKRLLWMKREEESFRTEKMNIIGELAAGMAHELRNPLTTMKGFIQLSQSQSYNIKPWFDIIMNEITRMSELTAEFLQFSKPHISNIRPESIAKCVERVTFLMESQAVSRGHTMHVDNVDETVLVQMDRDKVVQVLLNIIRNAIEAMQQPGHIFISAEQNHQEVVIQIEDTGIGMQQNELEKIFNPFYTTKENGTGLGLSICYKIVQDHGGTMTVQSAYGRGSVFIIKLPVILSPATAAERLMQHALTN